MGGTVGAEARDPSVEELQFRNKERSTTALVCIYGTIDSGLETMRYAWPSLDHVFSICEQQSVLHVIGAHSLDRWEQLVDQTLVEFLPKVVFELWAKYAIGWTMDP